MARGVAGASVEQHACLTPQAAVTTAEFTALYELCVESGFKAHVAFSHSIGH
jgi:hypothetical protein